MALSGGLTGFPPFGTVLHDPICERTFKPDVMPGLFRLDPLMFEDLLALSLKLTVKR